MATQGSPAKFSYAIAEREDASPWEPLHAGLGFGSGQSVVTVYGGEPPHNVNDHVSTTAAGILNNVADVAATLGSNVGWYFSQSQLLVVLGPEHAATIAADGFTKADVQRFVFEHARLPLRRLRQAFRRHPQLYLQPGREPRDRPHPLARSVHQPLRSKIGGSG